MAYKIGFLLSLVFIVQLFVLAGDLMAIQVIYTNLDAVSITAGEIISRKGGITQEVIDLVEEEAQATITAVGDNTPLFGSAFRYRIAKEYDPFLLPSDNLEIAVTRSVVIGYYT